LTKNDYKEAEICVLIFGEMGILGVDFNYLNIDDTMFGLLDSEFGNMPKYAAIALGGICIVLLIKFHLLPIFNTYERETQMFISQRS